MKGNARVVLALFFDGRAKMKKPWLHLLLVIILLLLIGIPVLFGKQKHEMKCKKYEMSRYGRFRCVEYNK